MLGRYDEYYRCLRKRKVCSHYSSTIALIIHTSTI